MKSLIVSYICTFIMGAYKTLQNSVFWNVLGKVHLSISDKFSKSLIVNFIKQKGKAEYESTSVVCKLLRVPTAILSYLCNVSSKTLRSFVDRSIAFKYIKSYVSGGLSVDTRFIAMLLLFGSVSGFLVSLLKGEFRWTLILIAVFAFLLSFVRLRLADFLDDSVIVSFVKNSLGFEDVSLNIYKKQTPFYVYFSAAAVGCVAGICGAFVPMMYLLPVALLVLGAIGIYPVFGIFCAVFAAPIVPTMVLVGICVYTSICVLAQKSYTGNWQVKMGRCGLSLMLFLIISAISTLFSFSVKGSIGVLGMYIIFIGFYYIIRDQIKKETLLQGLFKFFSISAVIVSLYGILQYIFGWDISNAWIDEEMFEEATFRVYSTLANPNVLGEYLILALPIMALVIVNYTKNNWQKFVYGVFFAITLICLVLTQSRGCWIGFFVSAVIFVTYYKSSLWKVLPFLLLLLPFVLPETIINRFMSVGDMTDSSTSYRVYIWLGTLAMMRNFWIGGIGLGEGAFGAIYPYYSYTSIVAPHSHNLFLQILVESGIGALIVFVVACLIFMKDMINIQNTGKKYGIVATALVSAVMGFLVQSMFDYTFYNYRVMCIFFMVMALGGALTNISYKNTDKSIDNEDK